MCTASETNRFLNVAEADGTVVVVAVAMPGHILGNVRALLALTSGCKREIGLGFEESTYRVGTLVHDAPVSKAVSMAVVSYSRRRGRASRGSVGATLSTLWMCVMCQEGVGMMHGCGAVFNCYCTTVSYEHAPQHDEEQVDAARLLSAAALLHPERDLIDEKNESQGVRDKRRQERSLSVTSSSCTTGLGAGC